MAESAFDVANELQEYVDGVRASERRIVVVIAPDEKHINRVPEATYENVMDVISDTMFVSEYRDPDSRLAEKHTWSGGRFNDCILRSSEQPAGYELQLPFTK